MPDGREGGRAAHGRRLGERALVVVAALVCLLFAATLRDVGDRWVAWSAFVAAPGLPSDVTQRDASLAALVVDETGRPLEGATVRVFAIRDGRAYFVGECQSDGDGHAGLKKIPRGEAWVLAYGEGRARSSLRVLFESGERRERIELAAAVALEVVVVDGIENPVEGALLTVTSHDPLPFVARTDTDGKARFDRLGAAPFEVRASAVGFDDVVRPAVVPSETPLRIKLEHLATVDVRVVTADGESVPHATVLAAGSGLWPPRSTDTDDDGIAIIQGLRGGVYDLKARSGELVSKTKIGVGVARGERASVTLTLEPGKHVVVEVVDGESDNALPVKNASVVLVEDGISSFPLFGRTDKKGLVTLGPIAKESSTVSARAAGFASSAASLVEPDATEARVVLRRGGVILGDVVDDRGYPVAGASIEVVGVDAEGMPIDESSTLTEFRDEAFEIGLPGPLPLIPVGELGVMPGPVPDLPRLGVPIASGGPAGEAWVTKKDGTFRCDPATPGRVQVIVRHPSYVEAITEAATLAPGGELHVHVVLSEGGWIEGRVVEEDRTPVGGARIELAATRGALERVVYAEADGTFKIPAAPDEVLLTVARPETPADIAARVTVRVPNRERAEVEIVLPKVRPPVHVRVVDDRGFAVPRVEVRVVSLDAKVPLRKTLFTNDDGEADLHDALDLPLRFTLVRPGNAPLVEQFDPTPDKVKFVMLEGVRVRGSITGRDGHDQVDDADVTIFTATGARHVHTDRHGDYVLDDMAAGRVRIAANAKGYASGELVAWVEGDRLHDAKLDTLDLVESGEVEGVVVDGRDDPVAGARVAQNGVPTYLPLGPLPRGITTTDKEGRFVLTGLPEGNVRLEAYTSELGRASIEGIAVLAGRTTRRVKIVLAGDEPASKQPRGAGSLAVTLGESDRGHRSVVVVMVPPGSEAEAAGIEPGDEIVSVNGRAVNSMQAARRRFTGPLGEDIVVELDREGGAPTGAEGTWLVRVRRERVRR